jgi:hypothetical protein
LNRAVTVAPLTHAVTSGRFTLKLLCKLFPDEVTSGARVKDHAKPFFANLDDDLTVKPRRNSPSRQRFGIVLSGQPLNQSIQGNQEFPTDTGSFNVHGVNGLGHGVQTSSQSFDREIPPVPTRQCVSIERTDVDSHMTSLGFDWDRFVAC